jgi:hydroxypyruvate isomerase
VLTLQKWGNGKGRFVPFLKDFWGNKTVSGLSSQLTLTVNPSLLLMNRREALKTAVLTGAFAALTRLTPDAVAAPEPSSKTSVPGGSFRHAANLGYKRKLSNEKFAAELKRIGVEGLDLLPVGQVETWKKLGLICSLAWGASKLEDGYNRRENHAKYAEREVEILRKCGELGVPTVICFSGNRRPGLSDEEGLEICVEGVKRVIGAAEKAKVTLVIELLNSKVSHKGYQCDHTAWGVELVKRVGSEYFKLLYDIFHMQIMEGDIIRTIRENHSYIAHYHTAGNPGRNEFEPEDVQELNYPGIMRAIHNTGYRGFVGQEFSPRRDAIRSLEAAVKLCTVK